jgi:hypothetical protein
MSSDAVWDAVKAEILAEAAQLRGRLLFKSVGKKAAQKYLLDLCQLVLKLNKHLDKIPAEAWEAIHSPFPTDPHAFRHDLVNKLVRPASEAIKAIRDDPRPGIKGRREEFLPRFVAKRAAEAYKAHTGKMPTRDELQCFLEELFRELEISASPEHYARERMQKK